MPPIVQRISLEGGQQVISTLDSIGVHGRTAIQNIQNAANSANFARFQANLRTLGEQSRGMFASVEQSAKRLAATFGLTFGAGIGALGVSLLKMAHSSSEAVDNLDDLAKAAGATTEEMGGLFTVFAQVGIGADALEAKFRKLAVNTQNAWDDIKKSIEGAADLAEKNQLAITDSTLGVAQAQLNLRKAYDEVQKTGTSGIAGEQALLNLRQAQLAVSKAYISQTEARRKAASDEANTIENLVDNVEALQRGEAGAAAMSPENIFKGIVAKAGGGVEAIRAFKGDLNSLTQASAPAAIRVLYIMADVFKQLKDETLKTAIATKVMGRDVSNDFIKGLSRGSGAMAEQTARLQRLGLSIDSADAEVAEGFKESYATLINYVDLLRKKIGVGWAPLFTSITESVTKFLLDNISNIKKWFDELRASASAAITAITNIIKGVSFADFAKGSKLSAKELIDVKEWQESFEHIRDTVKGVKDDIVAAVAVIRSVLNVVAEALNSLFGTKFTGDQLGILLLIGQFTGLNQAILLVLGTLLQLAAAAGGLTALLGWPALLVAALVAAAVLIYKNWDSIVAAAKTAGDGIVGIFKTVGDAIYGFFKGIFTGVMNMGKAAIDFLKNLFGAGKPAPTASTAPEAAGGAAAPVAVEKAGGGLISGPGTGTSDSILARLSAGEFVVRAAAVRHVGTGFLRAVNSAPGYALGGLVDGIRDSLAGMAPGYARGGAVAPSGGLRPFTLVLPGGGAFSGLYAREDGVSSLQRASVGARVASTGRRPAWVK